MPLNRENFEQIPPIVYRGPKVMSHPPSAFYDPSIDATPYVSSSRAPMPPPRSYNYNNLYSSNAGYNRYMFSHNRPFYGGAYSSYQPFSNSSPYGAAPYYGSSFIEEAQESSREAFSSIESVVNAFGSINMMIESTYCALQSSFNAVLAVAENLSRLKLHVGHILSALTFFRSLKWFYRKMLHLLRLREMDPVSESAWKAANQSMEDAAEKKKSSWPVIMFFIAVYAGPFLMWKFINSLMRSGSSKDNWTKENGEFYYAIAKYSYQAQSDDEISFNAGDYLKMAPFSKQKDKNWPLVSNGKSIGSVPINYIDIKLNKFLDKNTNEKAVSDLRSGNEQYDKSDSKNSHQQLVKANNERRSVHTISSNIPSSSGCSVSQDSLRGDIKLDNVDAKGSSDS